MKLLIGVDWSQEHHNVRIQNEAGALVVRFQMAHSPDGLAKLEGEIDKLGVPPANCLIALETAHNLLIDFFWSRGYRVYVIAPSIVGSSRGRYTSSGAHDDDRDAFVLAELLRTDLHRFALWKPDGPLVIQMKAKIGLIDALTQSITRHSNRLRAVLQRYYPGGLEVFGDLQTQVCLRFLMAYPTPDAARALTYTEFAQFCRGQGYTHPGLIPDCYAGLRRASLEPDPLVIQAYQGETVFLAELVLRLVQQKNRLIADVQKLFAAPPDQAIFDSLPGAGKLLAPKLLVMFGDHRDRFPQPGRYVSGHRSEWQEAARLLPQSVQPQLSQHHPAILQGIGSAGGVGSCLLGRSLGARPLQEVSVQNLGTCSVFPTGAAKRHTFGATRPTSMLCMALFRADAPPTTYFTIY